MPYFIFSMVFFIQTLVSRHYRTMDWIKAQSLAFLAIPVYTQAAIDSLFHRKAVFEKTDKDVGVDEIEWKLLKSQILFIVLSVVAVILGVVNLITKPFDFALLINVFWAAFHLFLMSYLIILILYGQKWKRA